MLPPASPAVCGANVTFIAMLCPGANVMGNVAPLVENSVPLFWIPATITLHDRVLVIVTGKVDWLPVVTDPKESTAGFAESAWLVTLVPPICNARVGFDALL